MGRFKWDELGIDYRLREIQEPSVNAVEQACAQFRAAGVKAY
jgi:hypothetical protein